MEHARASRGPESVPARRPAGLTRRQALRTGAAGGALVWSVPVVQAIGVSAAHAQTPSPVDPPPPPPPPQLCTPRRGLVAYYVPGIDQIKIGAAIRREGGAVSLSGRVVPVDEVFLDDELRLWAEATPDELAAFSSFGELPDRSGFYIDFPGEYEFVAAWAVVVDDDGAVERTATSPGPGGRIVFATPCPPAL